MNASTRSTAKQTTDGERGSALLIVLVFAAILAISLYRELPVVEFESQRQKEQLLIDRGNEYAHAIKLFVRKTQQYPPSLDALENTNRMRFLRKRFKDPFTGKDDWRLLHSGPGGIIIDSKVNAVNANGTTGANGTNNPATPNGNSPGNTGFNSAAASNSGFGGFNGSTSGNSAAGGFNSGMASNSVNMNNNAGSGPGQQNSAGFGGFNSGSANRGSSFGGYLSSVNANANTDSGNPQPPSGALMRQRAAAIAANRGTGDIAGVSNAMITSSTDPTADPSRPGNTGPNSNSPNGPGMQMGIGQSAGSNPNTTNAQNSPFNNRTAPGTSPPSGGLGAGSSSSSGLGVMQGGMIAGVASKAEGTGIKTVNDQSRYQLWEFVYDATKDAARQMAGAMNQTGAAAAAAGAGNTGMGQGMGTGANTAFGNSGFGGGNSAFGQSNSGFGNSNNGFGRSNTGFGNSNSGFGNSNSGFGNSNNGFANSNNGFGSSNNGFGNSNSGFGGSNSGFGGFNSTGSSSNGWSTNSSSTTPPNTPTSTVSRP